VPIRIGMVPTTTSGRWRFALKPASWPKLLVPFLIGQGIGIDATGSLSIAGLVLALAFTALDIVFVVTLNDWGDREVDAIKRRMFPHTSPKTIPDGVLSSGSLLLAGLVSGALAVALAVVAHVLFQRTYAFPGVLAALGLFVAYTLPPLRLNYRGGGELLEGLGVGVVLPWLSAYLQSGRLWMPALDVLPGFACLCMASAIASGLSDERSDRAGGKRTVVTMLGNPSARSLMIASVVVGGVTWLATAWLARGTPTPVLLGAAGLALSRVAGLVELSRRSITDAFTAQHALKTALHRAVWEPGLVIAGLLAAGPLLGL
jgi:1,4-dihydroxy-2-naphthoate octaprenyltransferase/chlorophyll synthase